jgi:rhomboid protease GluP
MDEIQYNIMNVLSSQSNYNIIECKENKNSIWGLFRENNNVNEFILFIKGQVLENEYSNIYNYIKNNYKEQYSKVHMIIMGSDEELTEINNTLKHPYKVNNVEFDVILVDEVSNKVIQYDEGAYNTALLINKITNINSNNSIVKQHNKIVTNVLITINVAVFLLTAFLSKNIVDIDGKVLLLLGAKQNQLINSGQYYRLLTAMFLHGGLLHIVFNMYALKSLGPFIESIYGRLQFIIIYFLGGICSSLLSYFFSDGMSVGASGAIFALLGAALIFGVKNKSEIGKNFLSSIIQVIVVNLIMGFTISNIDNYGHIGGLIGGIIISLLLFSFNEKKRQRE